MSDLLAIIEDSASDEHLVEEIQRRHPDRVTLLLQDGDSDPEMLDSTPQTLARRARIGALLAAIERTGAVVVGLVASRDQLRGWRFDRIVGGSGSLPAF
ncbi:MAG: hypothetical protein ACP5H2_10615 [Solirubrobacteraceae bacterium]